MKNPQRRIIATGGGTVADEDKVREAAQAHADAMVAGDLGRAAQDLTDGAKPQAAEVMKQTPRPITSAEIVTVEAAGDECVVRIDYGGTDKKVTVESVWSGDDRPRMTALKVV